MIFSEDFPDGAGGTWQFTLLLPRGVKLIAHARVKTDRQDVFRLVRLLAGHVIPEVWVPPVPVRELRNLVSHSRRLIQLRTMTRNRLHSLAHRHNLILPEGGPFADKNQGWWKALQLSLAEKLRLQHEQSLLEFLELPNRRHRCRTSYDSSSQDSSERGGSLTWCNFPALG